jgi:hypothetical protein
MVSWVRAPIQVRLPPQVLRLTTAGRMACLAGQTVQARILLEQHLRRRPPRHPVGPGVHLVAQLDAGGLEPAEARVAVPQVGVGGTKSALAMRTVDSEPPLAPGRWGEPRLSARRLGDRGRATT